MLQPVVKIEDIIEEIPLSALVALDKDEDIPLSALVALDKDEDIPLSALVTLDKDEDIPLSALVALDKDEDIPLSALVAFNSNKLSGNDSENSLTSLMEIKTEGIPINIDYICNVLICYNFGHLIPWNFYSITGISHHWQNCKKLDKPVIDFPYRLKKSQDHSLYGHWLETGSVK